MHSISTKALGTSPRDSLNVDRAVDKAETSEPNMVPSEPVRTIRGWRWALVLVAIYCSTLLYGLDNTIAAAVQGAIVNAYGEIEKLTWLGVGFPLGSIATILTFGKSYSIFDVKWLYIGSLTIFAAGSALCGGAPTMNALIVGRTMAGAGGAGMYLGTLNLIAINTTERERPLYMGFVGLIWGTGTILGPVVGGGFAESGATWRWAFYINLIIFGLMSPILLFCLPSFQPQPGTPLLTKLRELDWLGVVLNAALYATWVIALTFGGATWAWSDGRTIAVFVVFGAVLIAFMITQYFPILTTPENRLFPIEFLKRRSLVLLYICTACAATALFIPIYYIPVYFQFVHGDNPLKAAVRLLPFIVIDVFFAMTNGATMPLLGYYFPWFMASGVFMLLGGVLMYTVSATTSIGAIYGFTVLVAIGSGCTHQAAYSIAPAKVDPTKVPAAIGFINIGQIGAIVMALTISGTIFQNVAYKNLASILAGSGVSESDIRSAVAGADSSFFRTLPPQTHAAALDGIVNAIDKVWILVVAAGALGFICSWFLRREKLFAKPKANSVEL